MGKKLVSFRLEEQLIEDAKKVARKSGLTLTDFVTKAIECSLEHTDAELDINDFKQSIDRISEEFNDKIQEVKKQFKVT